MRAAACLARRHPESVRTQLVRWVSSEETAGLGIQTLGLLDELPEDIAVEVARAALADGPAALRARERLQRVELPAVAALLEAP